MSYSIQLSSQLVLSHYNSYSVGYAILYTNWLICEVVWLARFQLPVVFKYRLVTVLVPLVGYARLKMDTRGNHTCRFGMKILWF
jgi:hypothetical protein